MSPDENYHLFRLLLPKQVWSELQQIASHVSTQRRAKVSVSDLARGAITEWLSTYRQAQALGARWSAPVSTIAEMHRLTDDEPEG